MVVSTPEAWATRDLVVKALGDITPSVIWHSCFRSQGMGIVVVRKECMLLLIRVQ